MKTNSPSVCWPHDMSVCHTNIMTSQLVCLSKQSPDRHTMSRTSLSLCQSRILSVCHSIIPTSPSICQLQDSSVCYPARHIINPAIWQTVCLSSVMSVLPSANPTVKITMSIPVRNFLHDQNPGKIPFVCTSSESSVHHSDSPSINLSPSAANPSKITCNYRENTMVNYLHENPVKSPTIHVSYAQPIHSSCVMSDIAPVCALSIPPIRTSCVTSVFFSHQCIACSVCPSL